ncbi:MAG: hypothetical protein KFB95_09200 [Simkaniaceae bacterium]|nr:MAG: hypothetical protein KFB95_09200 [Simkaniaceae bacterium]
MSTVTNSNSGAANQPPQPSSGVDALFQMQGVLAEVLGQAISAQGIQATSEQDNALTLLQNDLSSTQNLDKEVENQKHHGFWGHFLNIAVDVAMGAAILGSLATGDVAGALLMGGLMAATMTGGQQAMANGISKGLQDLGVPENIANIAAAATVIVAFAAAGAGLGSIDSVGEAAEGAEAVGNGARAIEEGSEMIDVAAEEGSATVGSDEEGLLDVGGSNIFEEEGISTDEAEKASEKAPSKTKKMIGSALMAGSATTGAVSMDLTQSIVALADPSGANQKLITALIEIVFMVASIGGSMAGAGLAISTSTEGTTMKAVQAGLKGAQGAFMAGEGVVSIQTGITTKNIAETNSELTTLHALSSRNTEMLKDTTKRTSEILETYENILSETDFFSGDAAAAEAMV